MNPALSTCITTELIDVFGDDALIADAARVSTGTDRLDKGHDGLIGFLMRNKHGTPFEHGSMTFRCEAPIFVMREFVRHRVGVSINETSGRYRELETKYYYPSPGRPLTQQGKPGEYTFTHGTEQQREITFDGVLNVAQEATQQYRRLLDHGVAKEVARMVLPVNVYTQWYATMNPRSIMHFLSLRAAPEAMYEIQVLAESIEQEFEQRWPVTHRHFNDNGRQAP